MDKTKPKKSNKEYPLFYKGKRCKEIYSRKLMSLIEFKDGTQLEIYHAHIK